MGTILKGLATLIRLVPVLAIGLALPPNAQAKDRLAGVPHYQDKLDGTLEYKIAMPQSEYRSDQRIIVYQMITNLSRRPIDICETCFVEGVYVRTVQPHPEAVCGWYADHVPGFKANRVVLQPGETREVQDDVTNFHCAFRRFGPGEYLITGAYCHEHRGTNHGIDSPDYCIDATSLVIRVVAANG